MKRTYGRKHQKRILRDSLSNSDNDETAPTSLLPASKAVRLAGKHDTDSPSVRKWPRLEQDTGLDPKSIPSVTTDGAMAMLEEARPSMTNRRSSRPVVSITDIRPIALPSTSFTISDTADTSMLDSKAIPVESTRSKFMVPQTTTQKNNFITGPSKRAKVETDVEDDNATATSPKKARKTSPSKSLRTYSSRSSQNTYISISSTSSQIASAPTAPALNRSSTLPTTPSRAVNDLSHMFDFTSLDNQSTKPALSARASSGIVSRMLGRARTEASLSQPDNNLPYVPPVPLTRSPSVSSLHDPPQKDDSQPSSTEHSPSRSAPVPLSSKHSRTYGGASRSFLVALPAASARAARLLQSASGDVTVDEEDIGTTQPNDLLDDLADDPDATRESYTDLRAKYGVDLSEDDSAEAFPPLDELSGSAQSSPEVSPSKKARTLRRSDSGASSTNVIAAPVQPYNALKSITEMRSKGESRRFMDEMGYLLEGLEETTGIGVKRGSALEIIGKFCNEEFAHKAKTADFSHRIWELLRGAGAGAGDKILDNSLVVLAALLARNPREISELAEKTDLSSTLLRLLSSYPRDKDILTMAARGVDEGRLKKAGVLRGDKAHLNALLSLVKHKTNLWPSGSSVYVSTMIVSTLATLPPSVSKMSNSEHLILGLVAELGLVSARLTAYAAGLALSSTSVKDDMPCWEFLESALRLFDSILLGQWTNDREDDSPTSQEAVADSILENHKDEMVDGLVALCIAADIGLSTPDEADNSETLQSCISFAFRVLVNLTHHSAAWSLQALANSRTLPMVLRCITNASSANAKQEGGLDLISPAVEDERDTQSFDRLCIALALLTNLVQGTDDARQHVQECFLSSTCKPGRSCADGPCVCSSRSSALQNLVATYAHYGKPDSEDASAVFIRGHLAVLFSLLMRDSNENQKDVLTALPGTSYHTKLGKLVEHAKAFVSFYAELSGEASRNGRDKTGRNNTATEALVFLKDLRDSKLVG